VCIVHGLKRYMLKLSSLIHGVVNCDPQVKYYNLDTFSVKTDICSYVYQDNTIL